MADNDLPAPTPAPAPAPTPAAPEPAPKPADANPANPTNPLDDLTDDEKKYLAGQKIEGLDLSKGPDAIRKIINHAQASQKQLSKLNDQFQKAGLRLEPDAPANPFGQPAAPSQPQPDGTPQPAPSQDGSIDQATAFTLSTSLATSFPELKDDLVSGKFYKDMQALGIPIKVGGQVNLDGILKYGTLAQKQAQIDAKLEELNKPGEGAIPDANPTAPAQPAADAPMTKQIALAIGAHVAKGGSHPRADEAKQFLQSNIGK